MLTKYYWQEYYLEYGGSEFITTKLVRGIDILCMYDCSKAKLAQ